MGSVCSKQTSFGLWFRFETGFMHYNKMHSLVQTWSPWRSQSSKFSVNVFCTVWMIDNYLLFSFLFFLFNGFHEKVMWPPFLFQVNKYSDVPNRKNLARVWFGRFNKPVLVWCITNDQTAFGLVSTNGQMRTQTGLVRTKWLIRWLLTEIMIYFMRLLIRGRRLYNQCS